MKKNILLYFKYSLEILEKTFNTLNFICEIFEFFYKSQSL